MENNPNSIPPLDVIDRYLAGELTAEEAQSVTDYFSRNPKLEATLRRKGERQFSSDGRQLRGQDFTDLSTSWHLMLEKVASQPGPIHPPSLKKREYFRNAILGVSAAGLVIAGWLGGMGKMRYDLSTYSSSYSTPAGKQATVTLPDGTVALLNAGTRISVPGNYMNGNRSVRIVGEALFTVSHHSSNPLVVITSNSITKVLGTQFVVSKYQEDSVSLIAVREGRVSVGESVLSAGQQAIVTAEGDLQSVAVSNMDSDVFSFSDGLLVLDNVPFSKAVARLNRWYDSDIRIMHPSLEQVRINGRFTSGSISDLIEILNGMFNAHIERHDNIVTISPR